MRRVPGGDREPPNHATSLPLVYSPDWTLQGGPLAAEADLGTRLRSLDQACPVTDVTGIKSGPTPLG